MKTAEVSYKPNSITDTKLHQQSNKFIKNTHKRDCITNPIASQTEEKTGHWYRNKFLYKLGVVVPLTNTITRP